MSRWMLLFAPLVVLVAAAAPPPATDEDIPIPPIPPAHQPSYQSAPMPDQTLSAPTIPEASGPQIRPDLFNQRAYNGGQGYTPGSTIERQQQQRDKPIPGINITMPLR